MSISGGRFSYNGDFHIMGISIQWGFPYNGDLSTIVTYNVSPPFLVACMYFRGSKSSGLLYVVRVMLVRLFISDPNSSYCIRQVGSKKGDNQICRI